MGYELTGNPISSTYTRLVQCVSSNYYDGLGNRLDLVHNSSLGLFVAKAGDTMTGILTNNAGIIISAVTRPPAFTVALAGEGPGSVDAGLHHYYISYVTALGETELTADNGGETSGGIGGEPVTTSAGDGKVNITLTASSDYRVTGINVYRNKVTESIVLPKLVASLPNTTQVWQDNIPDSSLTGNSVYNQENKTNRQIFLNDERAVFIGKSSTYVGYRAGKSVTTGGANTLVGANTGVNITTGIGNIGLGRNTMGGVTTGSYNIGIGDFANYYSATTGNNVAIGYNSLMRNTTGSNSTAVGHYCGRGVVTGGDADQIIGCTYLGSGILCSSRNVSNEIAIGYLVGGIGSNSVVIGNTNITKTALRGNVGIGTIAPAATLDVSGNANIDGSLYVNSGGIRIKGNTTDDRLVADTGLNFTPVNRPAGSTIDVSVLNVPGNVTAGTHHYSYSFITPLGETEVMSSMPVGPYTFDASHGQAVLTVPVSTDYRVTGRKIYRTYANAYGYTIYLLATISDNTTTTYIDNLADTVLTGAPAYYRPNTTSEYVTINGTRAMLFADTMTLIGKGAGTASVTGGANLCTFVGTLAGASITSGAVNTALGYSALNKCTTGGNNAAIGEMAAYNATGTNNTVVGTYALCGITGAVTGSNNVVIGRSAGYNVTGGFASNTVLGYGAGYNASGNNNIFLGYTAGNYSTAGNRLVIDSITRADASAERDRAIIYGVMSDTPANQILKLGGGGKVGINTITPTTTLDVSGSLNVNGNIYVDGSVGFTGDVSAGQTMRFKNGILVQVL